MDALRMSSITYRIATGAQVGRKVVHLLVSSRETEAVSSALRHG
jgi:hypothetical protein